MQFLRQQSARWSAGKPSTEFSHENDNDDKVPRNNEESDGETKHPESMNGNGEDIPAPQQLPGRVTSVSSFLASSILRISRDVSQQAAAAADAYMTHQQNRVFEQEDPVLQDTLRLIQQEHEKIKTQQQTNRTEFQEYQREQNEIKAQKLAKERDMWLKQQNNRLNPLGLKEYKALFLPESDASTDMVEDDASTTSLVLEKEQAKLITAQAKLCRTHYNEWMTDRQMTMMRTFQQEMIDYMFNGMMPTLKNEAIRVERKGKEDLEKYRSYKQEVEELYRRIIALQEQVLQEYRSKLTPQELDAIRQELEAEKMVETGEVHQEKEDDDAEVSHFDDSKEDADEKDDEEETDEGTEEDLESVAVPPKETSSLGVPSSRQNEALKASSSTHEKIPHEFQMSAEKMDDVSDVPTISLSTSTPMGTPDQPSDKKPEDIIVSSGVQERIAERTKQRTTQEEDLNHSKSTSSAPGKTSSRSDLLERARMARKQNAATMKLPSGRPNTSRHSSGSAGVKVSLTASERVAARRELVSRQQNNGSINHHKDGPTGAAASRSVLSEEQRAQIRNGLRAGNSEARKE
jgi:hypothetical protein